LTPCQATIPAVHSGRYKVVVLSAPGGSGCGANGTEVLLWTFAGNKKIYATVAAQWPQVATAVFNPQFLRAAPMGAAAPVTELSGEVLDHSGTPLDPGAVVDAYIGTTKCGTASVRQTGDFTGYVMNVIGPTSLAGCKRGAHIAFQINGKPAKQTYVNSLRAPKAGSGGSFPLTVASP
jgi:hypothetical protein